MARSSLVAVACWCLLSVAGCADAQSFLCLDDAECGEGGVCEDNGSCSFVDPSCESGRRYGEYAPARIAEACVAAEPQSDAALEPSPEPTGDMPASGVCAQEESCELCLSCTFIEAPCAEHVVTCSINSGCLGGLNCALDCLMSGDCEDCCAVADPVGRELIETLSACQVSECAALCGETRVPECW